MNRKQILAIVEQEPTSLGNYDLLKDCLNRKLTDIDPWFQALVRSVRNWQPNTKLLVINAPQKTGVSNFFEGLIPDELRLAYTSSGCITEDLLYESLVAEFPMRESVFKYIQEYNFRSQIPKVDKRLCSYCTTWNSSWKFQKRKNVIVVKTESIDWDMYKSINKTDLWREIFKIF